VGAVDQRVRGGGAGVEEVGFNPFALAVDVRVDAMSPFRVGSGFGDVDIDVDVVGGCADPDVAALPRFGVLGSERS
jgi:hypothetical protein